jgi:hypothetical protein
MKTIKGESVIIFLVTSEDTTKLKKKRFILQDPPWGTKYEIPIV